MKCEFRFKGVSQMKTTVLFLIFTVLSTSSFAKSWKFDCGKYNNTQQIAEIQSAATTPGEYSLLAQFETRNSSNNPIKLSMEGQRDLSTELTGKEISVFAFLEIGNPANQLVIKYTEKETQVVKAQYTELRTKSVRPLLCKLLSFKN
jgi:hypothetical protein